jgi:hypothetical protein
LPRMLALPNSTNINNSCRGSLQAPKESPFAQVTCKAPRYRSAGCWLFAHRRWLNPQDEQEARVLSDSEHRENLISIPKSKADRCRG